jgi:cytoskeletal protein CcmA (bactofilin family)
VNPYLAVVALMMLCGVALLLPLIPALVELKWGEDELPLKVIQEHAGEIRYFADGFRNYIKALEPVMHECLASGGTASGTMPDGAEYVVLGRCEEALALPLQQHDEICSVVLATSADLVLPSATTFLKDIYAGGGFIGGIGNHYRAILGDRSVQLGRGSRVMRWVHAVGEFRANEGCRLYGRVSSDSAIRLHAGCSFLRLNAPRIETGPASQTEDQGKRSSSSPRPLNSSRMLLDHDFQIGAGEEFTGNLVVRGRLRVGAGARVWGSIKSSAELIIERDVFVSGSLISATRMYIGQGGTICGPLIAERELEMEAGTRCGGRECPTTVSAPSIKLKEGVVVFGTLWARERGQVVEKL